MRLVLAVSLDGRLAPPEGVAAQLGGDGDRRALEHALAWADACLIGAGTLRAHQCTCLIRDGQLLEQRRRQGRPDQPAALVVSHQATFPRQWRFFEQPLQRWLLAPQAPSEGFDRWLPLARNWNDQLQELSALGMKRLVLLGGAGLAGDLLQHDAIDELQLTLVPRLLGGGNTWVPGGLASLPDALTATSAWSAMEPEPLGEGEWLMRYQRRRSTSLS